MFNVPHKTDRNGTVEHQKWKKLPLMFILVLCTKEGSITTALLIALIN